ncbi:MAG: YezD family protein [Actinomycetota bacterium]
MGGDEARTPEGSELAALSEDERAVLMKVIEVLRKVKYGTVLLVVQDGKVVQIEMAEKIRLR